MTQFTAVLITLGVLVVIVIGWSWVMGKVTTKFGNGWTRYHVMVIVGMLLSFAGMFTMAIHFARITV